MHYQPGPSVSPLLPHYWSHLLKQVLKQPRENSALFNTIFHQKHLCKHLGADKPVSFFQKKFILVWTTWKSYSVWYWNHSTCNHDTVKHFNIFFISLWRDNFSKLPLSSIRCFLHAHAGQVAPMKLKKTLCLIENYLLWKIDLGSATITVTGPGNNACLCRWIPKLFNVKH